MDLSRFTDHSLLFLRVMAVFQIVANHAIVWGPPAWLATLAMMFIAWTAGTYYTRSQEERVVQHPTLLELLRDRMRRLLIETLVGGAVVGAFAIACSRAPDNPSLGLTEAT